MTRTGPLSVIVAALALGACFLKPPATPENDPEQATVVVTADPAAAQAPPYGAAPYAAGMSPVSLPTGMELPPAEPTPIAVAAPPPGTAPIAANPAAPANPGAVIQREVLPSTTDPSIRDPNDPHMVFVPQGPRNGKLLVFLPGTHGKPAHATLFLATAARDGYLSIGLSYPDSEPATLCRSDIDCFESFRREIWDGTNVSDKVEVSPTESIKNRLIRLLVFLDAQYPNEGWRAFLARNDLVYSSIAFAGVSQGGGFAAYIAKSHEVARVLMFSSVVDASDSNPPTPARWVSGGHVTPIDRYYGFDHVNDKFARKIAVDWTALGLERLGPRVSVDGMAPPFGNSHQLTTSIYEPDGQHAHTCVLPDHATPINDNVPLFQEVWRYMLLH
jgi:hypothetical protein